MYRDYEETLDYSGKADTFKSSEFMAKGNEFMQHRGSITYSFIRISYLIDGPIIINKEHSQICKFLPSSSNILFFCRRFRNIIWSHIEC